MPEVVIGDETEAIHLNRPEAAMELFKDHENSPREQRLASRQR